MILLEKIVAKLDKEMDALEGVRLLRQKAERQIEKMSGERNFDKRRKEI